MFNLIFGKEKMYFIMVYWRMNVSSDDLMKDLEKISNILLRSSAQKKHCKIDMIRNNYIDDTEYRTCEIYADEKTEWIIRNLEGTAIAFTATTGF